MNAESMDFNKNEDAMRLALSQLRTRLEKIALGGGKAAIEKQHEKNKLTARERIQYLVDKDSSFVELGALVGHGEANPTHVGTVRVTRRSWLLRYARCERSRGTPRCYRSPPSCGPPTIRAC